ncbi:MAG: Rieske 2Fe-2S domain-containing protein [Deltaproteobacteria bacterium]|nr:Rieske 2Fe-2S domain-containing protein [Deltaproteobacteria bacterium]
MSWERVVSVQELEHKKSALLKKGSKQIAVFKMGSEILAVDNRCPHQGYPLVQGTVDASVLTCNWHNWKFDMRTGKCLTGGDNVRTYPIKIEESFVWVEIAEPSKEELTQTILEGLKTAFTKAKYGRTSRELARLYFNGIDSTIAIKKSIEWSYEKFKTGTTHAYAACSDWLRLYFENISNPENQLICLTEAIDHMAGDALGEPFVSYSKDSVPFSEEAFISAIEAEDEKKAIALLQGALKNGLHFEQLEKVFTHAALMHYNDFGHALIYVTKTATVIEFLGKEVESPLLLSLTRALCHMTREDLLAEFQDISRYSYQSSYEALLEMNAKNFLYFDSRFEAAYDKPVSDNVGWLDVTHPMTFANAVRVQCQKYPEFWKQGLLQLSFFHGRNLPYVDTVQNVSSWAVKNKDHFFAECVEKILDHGFNDRVQAAHLLKTFCAVREEVVHSQNETTQKILLAALNRYFHSPLKFKHIRRAARQNMSLVGKDF